MPAGVMPVSLLIWFFVYHHRVAPLGCEALLFILGQPLPSAFSNEQSCPLNLPCPTTSPTKKPTTRSTADRRNKVSRNDRHLEGRGQGGRDYVEDWVENQDHHEGGK